MLQKAAGFVINIVFGAFHYHPPSFLSVEGYVQGLRVACAPLFGKELPFAKFVEDGITERKLLSPAICARRANIAHGRSNWYPLQRTWMFAH